MHSWWQGVGARVEEHSPLVAALPRKPVKDPRCQQLCGFLFDIL